MQEEENQKNLPPPNLLKKKENLPNPNKPNQVGGIEILLEVLELQGEAKIVKFPEETVE
jgi:hypothetical protein